MPSESVEGLGRQEQLLSFMRALTSLPSQILFHGAILLAIAATGGAALPGVFATLATGIGMNLLANMLERAARGEKIPDSEIRAAIEEAVRSSGIEMLVASDEFQRAVVHIFRRLDLLEYAVRRGDIEIAATLVEQFSQHQVILNELQDQIAAVQSAIGQLATREQAETLQRSMQSLSNQLNTLHLSKAPTQLFDDKITEETDRLRKCRFFAGFDRMNHAVALGRSIKEGELSSGSPSMRSRALAWCARVLYSEATETAQEFLAFATELAKNPETRIAQAFIYSQNGNKALALQEVGGINLPPARTAGLMIVAHHEGPTSAISWLDRTGLDFSDLDSDGKFFFVQQLLLLAQWDAAFQFVDKLGTKDYEEAPILHHIAAMAFLARAVDKELRAVAALYVPHDAASFPLASDAPGIDARRKAQAQFLEAARVEEQMGLSNAAAIDEEYELWLELRDPEYGAKAIQRLEERLRDPATGLRFVPLGQQFRIAMDFGAVERAINEQTALHGGPTRTTAFARLALSSTKPDALEAADYIAKYRDELATFFETKWLLIMEIEMLLQAGHFDRVDRDVDLLIKEGLSADEERDLRGRIAEARGSDPVQTRHERYAQTSSLVDLANLVDALQAKKDWEQLSEYGYKLFERTRSLPDAERYVHALNQTGKHELAIQFLQSSPELRSQSKNLEFMYCWALYETGALIDARQELAKQKANQDESKYRELLLRLGIALGDWASLSEIVATELREKESRSPQDLIRAGQLALYLSVPGARDLVVAAANKGKGDANILAAAYFLASEAGWEDNPEVSTWLTDAAALSGEGGPIQRVTLREILEQKPDWDRRESEVLRLLSRGQMPMFLAARSLNRSLVDLLLFPAFTNLSEEDPRRKAMISAYSGARRPTTIAAQDAVGMDATALLTLGFLGLLEKAFDAFSTIYLPHSTLSWLFEEKQKAVFHQPSRIRDAHMLRNLLATGAVQPLIQTARPNADLSAQIGDELSQLIAEAEKAADDNSRARLVVRPFPVPRLTSLLEENADLSSHESVLSGCTPIVDKLRQIGQITGEEAKRAHAYLQLQERPWPNQPQVPDRASLYLDDLTVYHFLHTGILHKLSAAGFLAIVSPTAISQASSLILYESIAVQVTDTIEHIRSVIHDGILTGKVRIGPSTSVDTAMEPELSGHPSMAAVHLAGKCGAVVFDDRFFNQHQSVSNGTTEAPVHSTLDLIDTLASGKLISSDERLEYRTILRRAGYFLIPVEDGELERYMADSLVQDQRLTETAELRAIRENILQIRMRDWLQLPQEGPWLQGIFRVGIQVLRGFWRPGMDAMIRRVQSKWIWSLIEPPEWSHLLSRERTEEYLRTGQAGEILPLLAPLLNVPREIIEGYWEWLDDDVLSPLAVRFPEAYSGIVEWYKRQVSVWADKDLTKEEPDDQ